MPENNEKPERVPVTFLGKKEKLDYEEFSNMLHKDMVEIFELSDKLAELCKEKQVPLSVIFGSDKFPSATMIYERLWDKKDLSLLHGLIQGTETILDAQYLILEMMLANNKRREES